jgi:hypothetical protein
MPAAIPPRVRCLAGLAPAEDAEPAEHGDEAREHEQRDVARQHIGEQAHAVGDRPRQERQHFDKYDQRQDVDRDALGHEQVEEVQPILPEAVDDDREEHQQRQRGLSFWNHSKGSPDDHC